MPKTKNARRKMRKDCVKRRSPSPDVEEWVYDEAADLPKLDFCDLKTVPLDCIQKCAHKALLKKAIAHLTRVEDTPEPPPSFVAKMEEENEGWDLALISGPLLVASELSDYGYTSPIVFASAIFRKAGHAEYVQTNFPVDMAFELAYSDRINIHKLVFLRGSYTCLGVEHTPLTHAPLTRTPTPTPTKV